MNSLLKISRMKYWIYVTCLWLSLWLDKGQGNTHHWVKKAQTKYWENNTETEEDFFFNVYFIYITDIYSITPLYSCICIWCVIFVLLQKPLFSPKS